MNISGEKDTGLISVSNVHDQIDLRICRSSVVIIENG